jgi:hypothetical protein
VTSDILCSPVRILVVRFLRSFGYRMSPLNSFTIILLYNHCIFCRALQEHLSHPEVELLFGLPRCSRNISRQSMLRCLRWSRRVQKAPFRILAYKYLGIGDRSKLFFLELSTSTKVCQTSLASRVDAQVDASIQMFHYFSAPA